MSNLISILIPAKNVALYIHECINSILEQTYANWELIIVDDSSTDNTHSILKEFEIQDNRITVFKNTGKGIIDALKLAYNNCSGEYITRMDADDIMFSNKLEILQQLLIEKGRGHVAIGQVRYFSEKIMGEGYLSYQNWLNKLTKKGSNYSEIYKECVIPSPCWMVKREDLDSCGAFNSSVYPEDYDLCFRFYKSGLKVIPTNQVLHKWRDYESRTSRTDSNYADNTFLNLKCKYFLLLDYNEQKKLMLLGAGKKGKKIAQYLIDSEIPFKWITNNKKKIGHNIYGKVLESNSDVLLSNKNQVIISIANPKEQDEIKESLTFNVEAENIFFFC